MILRKPSRVKICSPTCFKNNLLLELERLDKVGYELLKRSEVSFNGVVDYLPPRTLKLFNQRISSLKKKATCAVKYPSIDYSSITRPSAGLNSTKPIIPLNFDQFPCSNLVPNMQNASSN
jgi:hypothetical protein